MRCSQTSSSQPRPSDSLLDGHLSTAAKAQLRARCLRAVAACAGSTSLPALGQQGATSLTVRPLVLRSPCPAPRQAFWQWRQHDGRRGPLRARPGGVQQKNANKARLDSPLNREEVSVQMKPMQCAALCDLSRAGVVTRVCAHAIAGRIDAGAIIIYALARSLAAQRPARSREPAPVIQP